MNSNYFSSKLLALLLLPGLGCGPDKGGPADTGDCDVLVLHEDRDGDGFGDPASAVEACEGTPGAVDDATDCDDGDPQVYPGAVERCNALDDDCDRVADEDATGGDAWYTDADGDGYGDPATGVVSCEAVEGAIRRAGDCDDTDPTVTTCPWSGTATVEHAADAVLIGEAPTDLSGYNVAYAGDVNGDGQGDALVSTNQTEAGAGGLYLVHGPLAGARDLSTADAVMRQVEPAALYNVLATIGSAGDLDGDGYDDVTANDYLASNDGSKTGRIWVFEGPISGERDLGSADLIVAGHAEGGFVGLEKTAFADVDLDGARDVVVPSFGNLDGRPGGAVVLLGPLSGTVDLRAADASVVGLDAADEVGSGIGLGDLDGDGFSDLSLGARKTEVAGHPEAGALYVWEGPLEGERDTRDADGTVLSDNPSSNLGEEILAAGDLDGDGTGDLLVAAPYDGTSYVDRGAVYLYTGPIRGTLTTTDAAARLGASETDLLFFSKFTAGDLDLDGLGDFVVAWPIGNARGHHGWVTVAYGPLEGQLSLDTGDEDAVFLGDPDQANYPYSVEIAADLSGDAWPDLMIGSPSSEGGSPGEGNAGRSFILFGGP